MLGLKIGAILQHLLDCFIGSREAARDMEKVGELQKIKESGDLIAVAHNGWP